MALGSTCLGFPAFAELFEAILRWLAVLFRPDLPRAPLSRISCTCEES